MASAIRLRRLIAEDRPVIQGYDQDEYARRLYYQRPIQASLDVFRAARETTAQLLERMTARREPRADRALSRLLRTDRPRTLDMV